MAELAVMRRLAAILAADIAGYSRLMGENEEVTVRDLKAHQSVVLPLVPKFGGRIIDTAGDGILAEFPSVIHAVECAIEIQRAMAERNRDVPVDRRMLFRIGINLGDVIHDDARIYGDGINIAARLESIAEPGGICISSKVREEIGTRLPVTFRDEGQRRLKNIAQPVHVYSLALDKPPAPGSSRKSRKARGVPWIIAASAFALLLAAIGVAYVIRERTGTAAQAGSVPGTAAGVHPSSVAVLPFSNLSDEKGNEYFSDGISEELMTVLQKISGLQVTARSSSFSFKATNATAQEIGRKLGVAHLFEGSVRKSNTSVRITARLSRAATGEQLWADAYTRDLKDVFALQAELAQTIVDQLRGHLDATVNASSKADTRAQIQAAVKGGTRDPEAYDLYLLGLHHRLQNRAETTITAQRQLERAVEKDPAFAKAWAALAGVGALRAGWARTSRERQEAEALARKALSRALALEPDAPETQLAQLWNQKWLDLDWKGAAESLRRAQRAAPDFPRTVASAALLEFTRGRPDSALPFANKAVALDPLGTVPRVTLGMTLLALKRYEEAEEQFRRQMEVSPQVRSAHANIALTYLLRGRRDEALREVGLESDERSRLCVQGMVYWALKRQRIPTTLCGA